jgi:hypothetical protein
MCNLDSAKDHAAAAAAAAEGTGGGYANAAVDGGGGRKKARENNYAFPPSCIRPPAHLPARAARDISDPETSGGGSG